MNPIRLRLEEGYVVVTALVLSTLMLTIGLASFAFVDTEQQQSGRERERESRLNLTEGALSSQIFLLSRNWPESDLSKYPSCSQASTDVRCPNADQLRSQFSAVDFKLSSAWDIQVIDNPGAAGRVYSDSLLTAARWDQSGPEGLPDGEMWVRAEGRLDNRKRVVVARVRVAKELLPLPVNAAFVAHAVHMGNSGNKPIVNGGGIVRCQNQLPDGSETPPSQKTNGCEGYDLGQVSGAVNQNPTAPTQLVDVTALEALRTMAKAKGTYFKDGCPTNDPVFPNGDVVFVEKDTDGCDINIKGDVNTAAHPGMFILGSGVMNVKADAKSTWYGIIYALNGQKSTGTVVTLDANSNVRGAVYVDGTGKLDVGESKDNLTYDQFATQNRYVYGTAGIIQNTWRELYAG